MRKYKILPSLLHDMSSTPWSKASFITKKGRLRLVVQTEKLRSRDPRATTTYISFFPLSLLTLSKTEMWKKCRLEKAFNLPYMKAYLIFIGEKKETIFFEKTLNPFLPLLAVKWPFVGQPDSCWSWKMTIFVYGMYLVFVFLIFLLPMENWGIIFFCTVDGFFGILKKTSFQHLCTRLYIVQIYRPNGWRKIFKYIISHLYHRTVHMKRLSCDPQNHD